MSDGALIAICAAITCAMGAVNSCFEMQKIAEVEKKLDAILIIVSQPYKEVTK